MSESAVTLPTRRLPRQPGVYVCCGCGSDCGCRCHCHFTLKNATIFSVCLLSHVGRHVGQPLLPMTCRHMRHRKSLKRSPRWTSNHNVRSLKTFHTVCWQVWKICTSCSLGWAAWGLRLDSTQLGAETEADAVGRCWVWSFTAWLLLPRLTWPL